MRCTSLRYAWPRRLSRTLRRGAVEQRDVEVFLQHADAAADGGRGDPELGPGAGEALVAGGGLEEAQAFERGPEQHGSEPPDGLLAYAKGVHRRRCDRY